MEAKFADLPDELWELLEPVLPPEPPKPKGGRPRVLARRVMAGILYRLRTGCQWKAMPPQFASGATCHRWFSRWTQDGVFQIAHAVALKYYDSLRGAQLKWTSLDGSMVKAPKGGDDTGPNPTDRAKKGVKRHILTDARGVPIAVAISGANVPDKAMVSKTLDSVALWASRGPRRPEHLCLDKGYDYADVEREVRRRRIVPHIRRRGEPPLVGCIYGKPRRWVVERTGSWVNRYRALLVRWERIGNHYHALLCLGAAVIAFNNAMAGF